MSSNPIDLPSPDSNLRLIAFFLTQFHPTPENDAWWGKGFTEWTNVTKARPMFDGHFQPHLPTDLGFYDLRVRETRRDQISLAKEYGIDGFCYYYYWFSGTRLLHRPLDDMLADSESHMPFCLCWANENWTRRWDAAEREILIAQKHRPGDDLEFIKSLIPFFADPRYIKVGGAPLLIVYRPQNLPDPRASARAWRAYCRSVGVGEIHICAALTHGNTDYLQFGFDSGVEFPPHNLSSENLASRVRFYEPFFGYVAKYHEIAQSYIARKYNDSTVFRSVFPSWDNTPRTGNRGVIVLNGTPRNYEYWLAETLRAASEASDGHEQFVFINAWNEWAEGCHLEPDRKYNRQFLEATLRAKNGESDLSGFQDQEFGSEGAPPGLTLASDLIGVFAYHSAALVRRFREALRKHPRVRMLLHRMKDRFL